MKFYQQCIAMFIPIIMLMTLHQPAIAAPVELSLEDSIALALQNNHDIKYAKASREKYFWAVKQAEGGKGVSLGYTHTDERYTTYSSYKVASSNGMVYLTPASNYTGLNYYDNSLSLNYSLYTGGSLEGQIEQAKLALKVADLDIDVAKQQLKLDVTSDYLTVLEYRNEVKVKQETVNNYVDHLNLVNEKYNAGLVAKTEILSSQVNLATAQDSLIQAQNNYNNAVATLNNAMGMPHDTELVLNDDFTYGGRYSLTLEQCLQYAREHHPEIAQYEMKVASAQEDVEIAKSGYLPTVDLTAEQDWYDDHFVGSSNSNWLLKLTTSLNVFDSGVTKSKVKQAKHSVDMAIDTREKERDSILLNVRTYYLSMCEAEKRIDTNKISVEQAEENLNIEKVSYQVGVGTNLDLLDAVLDLDSAKKNYVQALYDYNTNKAKLERAMGQPVK